MSAELHVKEGILTVVFSGTVTKEDTFAARSRASVITKESGICLILVDLRNAEVQMSTMDIFAVNASHAEVLPGPMRHAILRAPDLPLREAEDAEFAETVAFNNGVDVRFFTEHAEAIQWLRQAEPDPDSGDAEHQ
jgi:hypothetical protein